VTTLATIGVALAGFFAFLGLPVAPLPPVDYPTITVNANMPGRAFPDQSNPRERCRAGHADFRTDEARRSDGIEGNARPRRRRTGPPRLMLGGRRSSSAT
jgi:hypothetical protein